METVIVSNSQFYSHYPRKIPKGSVNAEQVEIRLDKSWDGLTVRIHWLNVASNVEKKPLLELDQPNTIPWEVLTDLGELRMGLVGLDGETVIKPTIWLTYGYVSDGVDPESGSDPQPPTPIWEQQMVEQARVAAEAAEEAKDAAVNAEKAASQAGPYADEAKKSAEAAKEAQRAASTSAQEAGNAKDQANTASNAAKVHADAAGTAKVAAERAAETAGNAQSEAAQSSQAAANSAQAAERAKQEAQNAAAAFPTPSPEVAGMVPVVNPAGDGYVFGKAGSGELLLAEYVHQGNQEIHFKSFDWGTGIGECTEPHGLTEPTVVMLVPNDWNTASIPTTNVFAMPIEWIESQGLIYAVPETETAIKVCSSDKQTPLVVNSSADYNASIDHNKVHLEAPIGFKIDDVPGWAECVRLQISGVLMGGRYRYVYFRMTTTGTDTRELYTNNLLKMPSFGESKPTQGVFAHHNIEFLPSPVLGASFLYSNVFEGRRRNSLYWPGNTYNETAIGFVRYGPTKTLWLKGLRVAQDNAVWANGTVFRLYAKAVKE